MIVCHCKSVSDRRVRDAVRAGATCRKAVARACGAGSGAGCGACRPVVDELIAATRTDAATPLPLAS